MHWYYVALALVTGLGVPIAVIFVSTAQGKAAASAFEGIARQPEAAGPIQIAMIIALGFIEALALYCLLMFFLLQGKLPGLPKDATIIDILEKIVK
jgi:F-type H+-transporting ATPase subunit c